MRTTRHSHASRPHQIWLANSRQYLVATVTPWLPDHLQYLVDALVKLHGPVLRNPLPLGNKPDPLDELVYILLTLMTRFQPRIDRAYEELHALGEGTWTRLLDVPVDEIREVLRPLGFMERRTAQLLGLLEVVEQEYGGDLSNLQAMPDKDAIAALTALPGVGTKTAKCVLMYSLGRSVLPVDVHVARVAARLGMLPAGTSVDEADELLEPMVPPELRFDVHVQFVRHGRTVCKQPTPDCEACPLATSCPSALSATR